MGIKQSEFTVTQSISSGASIPYFQNATNFSISWDDFITSLGVTGKLEQIGDPLSVPVITKVGDTYKYRTLESGSGINIGLSPQNGATIKHNFKQDVTNVSLTSGMTLPQPVIASLEAGTGITIVKNGDVITISLA